MERGELRRKRREKMDARWKGRKGKEDEWAERRREGK